MVTDLDVMAYKNYDDHSALVTFLDPLTKTQGFIAFYRLNLHHPAFGATRIWDYPSFRDGIEDALQLAKMMMYKNAMAGTPYAGAKGILVTSITNPRERRELLMRYAKFVNFLSGKFITGADVGVSPEDVHAMKKISNNYIVGTKVDPVLYTVKGLLIALDIASKEVFGSIDLSNKSIAIQGVGKVGAMLVHALHDKVKTLYIADTRKQGVDELVQLYKNVSAVQPDEILNQKVDIFCPCAMGGVLNARSLKKIRAAVIIGSANNQIDGTEVGDALHKMGIFYAPDYVVNAGGVISVTYEYEHTKIMKKEIAQRVDSVGVNLKKVINYAHKHSMSMSGAADEITEHIIQSRKQSL